MRPPPGIVLEDFVTYCVAAWLYLEKEENDWVKRWVHYEVGGVKPRETKNNMEGANW